MSIVEMQKSEKSIIVSFDSLSKKFVDRLMDVGMYKGAEVTLLNVLAMGRLFLVEVDDIEICIRRSDASKIEVVKL
jgi:ferrous iron transport protein A